MGSQRRGLSALTATAIACLVAIPLANAQTESGPTLGELLAKELAIAEQTPAIIDLPLPSSIADWGASPADAERAYRGADEVLRALDESLPAVENAPQPSASDAQQAEELYRQAQTLIANRETERAIGTLRQSLRLDPTSIPAWRALGALLDEQANPIAARAAYAKAVALGDRDPFTLIRFGQVASRFRDDRLAAAALLTALAREDVPDDAGAILTARAELAQSLLRLGYLAESVRVSESLLDLPPTFDGKTDFRASVDEIYRQRRELLLRAAEAAHAIGEIDKAHRLMSGAWSIPGPRSPKQLAARVYLLLRTGHPAQAASVMVDRFADSEMDVASIDLLRYVAKHSGYAAQIGSDLDRIEGQLPRDDRAIARQPFALARAALHASPEDRAASLLEHLAEFPYDYAVLVELARSENVSAIERLIRLHPALEPRISRIALDAGLKVPDTARGALGIRSTLRKGLFQQALGQALEDADESDLSFSLLALRVELLGEAARGTEADELLDRALREALNERERLASAYALIQRGRHREALAALEEPSFEDRRPADAISRIGRMLALDATGDRVGALQVARSVIVSDSGCLPAREFLARYSGDPDDRRKLLDLAGGEGAFALIQGVAAFEEEQFDLAERSLLDAWGNALRRADTAAALVALWERTASVERAEEWLNQQIERYPDEPGLVALLARLQSDDRRPEDALDTLASTLMNRPGSATVSRELERVLREDFDAEDRWLSQARTRLANAPNTFATFAERAAVELVADNLSQAVSLMELATDLAPTLTRPEADRVNEFLEGVANEIANRPRVEPEAVEAYTRVFERLDAPSPGAWLGRISVASLKEIPTAEELTQLALRAGQVHPDIAERAFIYAAHAAIISSRTGQSLLNDDEARQLALDVYVLATEKLEPYPAQVLGAWIDFTQQTQDPFALGQAIRSLGEYRGHTDRRLRDALTYVMFRNTARDDPELSAQILADGAHHLASQLSLNDQFDTARVLYEEALRAKPDHVETNNSYGYRLLERGEDFERAVSMIETAYAASSQEPHIIDSLGWARYKQGRLEDSTDPQTGRVEPGAVSLLRLAKTRAIEADTTGLTTAPIVDHLGDALWASGDRERAVREWTEAAVLATRASKGVRGLPLPLSIEVEFQELIANANEKVRAASEDREPQIAPQIGPLSPR